jgi:hypothetical protein
LRLARRAEDRRYVTTTEKVKTRSLKIEGCGTRLKTAAT